MSLRGFHVLFVTLASLVSLAFAGWALTSDGYRALGLASLGLTAGLLVYGVWFLRKIRNPAADERRRRRRIRPLLVGLAAALAGAPEAGACSVCYGDAQGPLIDAARLGVWLLFGLVFAVQIGFVAFFWTLWRRAREHARRHPHPAR